MAPDSADPRAVGCCVGFEIHSELAFRTLRAGSGDPLLVDEREGIVSDGDLVASWHPRPGNRFSGRLHRDGARYAFWASDAGWFLIDPAAPSISVSPGPDALGRELRLFGVPTALCAYTRGDISLHASAVEVFGRGVLLAGPSRYGKTTLAGAFAQAGHRLLSEDSVRCVPSERPSVYPGPAVLRLRRDVASGVRVADTDAAERADGRTALVFAARSRGDGRPLPLAAIIILRQSAAVAALEPIGAAAAARDLFALTLGLPMPEWRATSFSRIVDLTARVETLNLHRPMTIESLSEVVSLVERHVTATS